MENSPPCEGGVRGGRKCVSIIKFLIRYGAKPQKDKEEASISQKQHDKMGDTSLE
jgi:hypothetical protein